MQYFKLFFVDYTRNLYFCVQNKYNITIKQGILMRFTLSSSALNARLQSLAKVINSKNALPILDSFLFEVKSGQLQLTASDSENVMTIVMGLDNSDGDGSFAVPSRTILDAVKELSEQPLAFEIDLNVLTVTINYQNGAYNFTAQNAEEYPRTQIVPDSATTITLNATTLINNVGRTLFATATDELRPVMNGIYFDLQSDYLAIVATDGHKLVRNKILNIKSDTPASFILPKKPANLIKTVLTRGDSNIIIKFDDRSAEIKFDGGQLVCRLLEGSYPNYNSVIPENPNNMSIDRKSLISTLRRVLPFASESSQLVRLHIEPGKLEVLSEDIDFATSAHEQIVCDYTGPTMNIGFKGSSLQEILNNIDCDEVIFQLADPSRAGVIVPTVQPENENVLALIMPMLLSD